MPAFEDAAASHDCPCDPRHLVGDGDRDDAGGLSGEQGDKSRIDRAGFLFCVSNQCGGADNQELSQISVAHLGNASQAFLAATVDSHLKCNG